MVKSYLRYELKSTIGIINSQESNVAYDCSGKLVVSAAIENVLVWNPRQGTLATSFRGDKGEVTSLQISPDKVHVAAGHSDGSITLYNLQKGTLTVTLQGHKKHVRAMRYNLDGSLLVSGSRDTDIIVWDVLSESGLYRLQGHKDEVTDVKFIAGTKYLISTSKDTLMKVWDLTTQHCIQTCVGHRSEIWTFDIDPSEKRLVTGTADSLIRVWSVQLPEDAEEGADSNKDSGNTGAPVTVEVLKLVGSFQRQAKGNSRAIRVRFSRSGRVLGYQPAGRTVELYKLCTERELHRKLLRKQKRAREKQRKLLKSKAKQGKKGAANEMEDAGLDPSTDPASVQTTLTDEYELLTVLQTTQKDKLRTFDFSPEGDVPTAASKTGNKDKDKGGEVDLNIVLGLQNNSLEVHRLEAKSKASKAGGDDSSSAVSALTAQTSTSRRYALSLPGHHADVRAVTLSSDDHLILSVAGMEAKVWNVLTCQCIRTLAVPADADVALCGIFVPGDRHVVLGTKDGGVYLYDVAAGDCVDEHQPHDAAVWSLAVRPDGQGFASGSADHTAAFWQFQMVQAKAQNGGEEALGPPTLKIVHSRTLKMADDVLCVRYSHTKTSDKLLFACALMDSTIKIFFEDSLKFFISLYGHKLPALSMDIASDDTLIATASADKNVKLWGLDFGDCHKSIFAHADSVMGIAFVPNTHYFWTVGKDRTVKYWDGDSYELIMTHKNHAGEVWCVAISSVGDFVVTGSHDRSVRVWERTDEQLFIEEEREKELEEVFDSQMVKDTEQRNKGEGDLSAPAGKRTLESMQAGERLMDALEMAGERQADLDAYDVQLQAAEAKLSAAQTAKRAKEEFPEPLVHPPKANIMMMGLSPTQYVLREIHRIKAQELEEALLVLPFSSVESLLIILGALMKDGIEVELMSRCLFFLLRTYQDQIVANRMLLTTLDEMRVHTRMQLSKQKDCMGFNLAGLRYLKRVIKSEEMSTAPLELASPPKKSRKNDE